MSTRSHVIFGDMDDLHTRIYIHSDGYPEGVGRPSDLLNFFRTVKKQVDGDEKDSYGYRFNHGDYLAAKYIVYKAILENREYREKNPDYYSPLTFDNVLAFGDIGAGCMEEHSDIEWIYYVRTDEYDEEGYPQIYWCHKGDEPDWSKPGGPAYKNDEEIHMTAREAAKLK